MWSYVSITSFLMCRHAAFCFMTLLWLYVIYDICVCDALESYCHCHLLTHVLQHAMRQESGVLDLCNCWVQAGNTARRWLTIVTTQQSPRPASWRMGITWRYDFFSLWFDTVSVPVSAALLLKCSALLDVWLFFGRIELLLDMTQMLKHSSAAILAIKLVL